MTTIYVTHEKDEYYATIEDKKYRCSIGENGLTVNKVEGDGCTPIGDFPLREIFYRADKFDTHILKAALPVHALTQDSGWCDDPKDIHYNKFVDLHNLEPEISHEQLHREDNLYDIIIVVGYNDAPAIPGKGSAIFIHIASENYEGTAGCIGFSESDLIQIAGALSEDSNIIITN